MKRQLVHRYEDIISLENLCVAWEEFVRGKRDKPDVQSFGYDLMNQIMGVHEDLVRGAYRHGSYHEFPINDPKPRLIHKASVRDRLVHHAVYRVLYPFFDRTFIADSFACRNGKGMHAAMDRLRALAFEVSRNHMRTCWVLKCDIRKFFASVDHRTLLDILEQSVPDRKIMSLLGEIIGSFSSDRPGRGLPLGNLTSQLFANVYLNELDQYVKHRIKPPAYLRYADDFIVLSHDRRDLIRIVSLVRTYLFNRLQLTLHPNKIILKTVASGVDFLGWVHSTDHRVLRTATKRRMFRRLAEHPTPETFQSYRGLLRHGNTVKLDGELASAYWLAHG